MAPATRVCLCLLLFEARETTPGINRDLDKPVDFWEWEQRLFLFSLFQAGRPLVRAFRIPHSSGHFGGVSSWIVLSRNIPGTSRVPLQLSASVECLLKNSVRSFLRPVRNSLCFVGLAKKVGSAVAKWARHEINSKKPVGQEKKIDELCRQKPP